MQSVIPTWVTVALAFLAPVAALVGVVVGAVMQRRTTRLQLEAGRERDRELWMREDRRRFMAEKRVVYADFLNGVRASVQRLHKAIVSLAVDAEEHGFGNAESMTGFIDDAPPRKLWISFCHKNNIYNDNGDMEMNMGALTSQVRLIAPGSVHTLAGQAVLSLRAISDCLIDSHRFASSLQKLNEVPELIEALAREMRKDLAIEPPTHST